MKVPISWLNQYVTISDLSTEELAEKLTFSGIEVEGIEVVGADLDDKFVVGEIIECERHPNADRLTVCKVSCGEEIFQVVCGAPNARMGLKTAFAKVGAVVPEGGFEIKKAKLRGVESHGMLCSAKELKVSDSHAGIMELNPNLAAGALLADILPKPETVLDLEITWNRPDCLSIIGVARELAALLQRPLALPAVGYETTGEDAAAQAVVTVEDAELCPRYTARMMSFENQRESPEFIKRSLELCGIRPLGLIVDITNYVLLECGQPLHAFDYDKLKDGAVVVRKAEDGEKLVTLDGAERRLKSDMLVIADSEEPVAIAGVMGGAGSEVTSATSVVLLESALFTAPSVKKTATALSMRTEASHRFERGVDPDLADWASQRACSLLSLYGDAKVAPGIIDVDNRSMDKNPVRLDFARVGEIIGLDFSPAEIIGLLARVGIEVVESDAAAGTFSYPSWRLDIACDADLIEEIARIHGLDKLPSLSPMAIAIPGADDSAVRTMALCRQTLLGFGLSEATHYSFLSKEELDSFGSSPTSRLALPNPVSADYNTMRDSLRPQLIQSLGRNYARKIEAPGLFEIGRVFSRGSDGHPAEETRVSLGFLGPFGRSALDRRRGVANDEAVGWLKGMVDALLKRLNAPPAQYYLSPLPEYEDGWSVSIEIAGETIGHMGLVTQKIRHAWRVNQPLAIAELRYAPLVARIGAKRPLEPIPAYPSVSRDLAFMITSGVRYADLVRTIREAAPPELTDLRLFDIFKGKEVKDCQQSMALTLEFRSSERTLTDNEVNAAVAKIVKAVKSELSIEVRES